VKRVDEGFRQDSAEAWQMGVADEDDARRHTLPGAGPVPTGSNWPMVRDIRPSPKRRTPPMMPSRHHGRAHHTQLSAPCA
jgi:hypothetical protein